MRAVVIGHGESVKQAEGIDDFDCIIRLKACHKIVGTKTHVRCGNSMDQFSAGKPFWLWSPNRNARAMNPDYKGWCAYFEKYNPDYWKPSTGLGACFCAKEFMGLDEIWLAGFDSHFGVWNKYNTERPGWIHDADAERRCVAGLFSKVHYLPML